MFSLLRSIKEHILTTCHCFVCKNKGRKYTCPLCSKQLYALHDYHPQFMCSCQQYSLDAHTQYYTSNNRRFFILHTQNEYRIHRLWTFQSDDISLSEFDVYTFLKLMYNEQETKLLELIMKKYYKE